MPSDDMISTMPADATILHLGGYTADHPAPHGLGRVVLGPDGFGAPEQLVGPDGPSWVLPRPGHAGQLLAVAEGDPGGVVLTDGSTELARCESGGDGPCHLAATADGRWVLASNYVSGTVGLIEADGDELTLVDTLLLTGEGPHERQDAPHAHQATLLGDDEALICDLGSDRVAQVQVVDGQLRHRGDVEMPPGTGPRHLALHPTREDVFWVVGELDQTVHLVRRTDDGWQVEQTESTAPDGPAGGETTTGGIAVDPAGEWVYVSTRGTDTVSVFAAGAGGELELRQQLVVDRWPRFIGWVPGQEGRLLLVAAEEAGTVRAYAVGQDGRDGRGRLTDTGAALDWPAVTWVG